MLFWSVYISLRDAVLISASHCVETSGSRMCFISTGKFELVRNLCVLYFGLITDWLSVLVLVFDFSA